MKLTYNNTDYWVSWQHITEVSKYTACNITTEGFNVVAIGIANCNLNDRYVKEIGRKISFQRALANLFPNDKDARKYFWNAYFNRK